MNSRLFTLQDQVRNILEIYPITRGSDEKLYAVYLTDKVGAVSVQHFFNNFSKYNVASFETVSRARRKVQEMYPRLKPPKEVLDKRDEAQGCFFDWARGV